MTSSDGNAQIRLNIKQHRQKLLQCLESINDTFLKPKIELVSKFIENSHLEPKTEIIEPETSEIVLKKLSDQLLEESQYYHGSNNTDEENVEGSDDHDISIRSDDCNEAFTIHKNSDVDGSDYDEQLVNDKMNKTYFDNKYSSGIPVLDVNDSTTRRIRLTRRFFKHCDDPLLKSSAKYKNMKRRKRENEKKSRKNLAECFTTLQHTCSKIETKKKMASKVSILLNAKKECDMLKCMDNHLCREKKYYQGQGKVLKNKLAQIIRESKL